MDIASAVNLSAQITALCVALGVLILGCVAEVLCWRRSWWKRSRGTVMPLALAAGFVAGYWIMAPFPKGSPERPWYNDEAWKLVVVAVLMSGPLLALARVSPKWLSIPLMLILAAALTLLIVRGPWAVSKDRPDWPVWVNWRIYAGSLAVGLCLYLVAIPPAGEGGRAAEMRIRLVGPVVMWACTSAAGVIVMMTFDLKLGRMFVMLAVLAGLEAVATLPRFSRAIAGGAGAFLAVMYASLLTLTAYYSQGGDWPLVRSAIILLGCAPLAAAVAWVPALQRRPWLCALIAFMLAGALLAPAAVIAKLYAPDMSAM